MYNEVKEIIMEKFGVDEGVIKPEAKLIEDLGADSLDMIELVMAFEDKYNIEVSDEEAVNIKTVDDVVKAIEERIEK